ncbi:copper resistance protein NlpE [Flavihumibacter sp. UBA7668]|uniref:copper resistance protein NlpE n=1 Tax=Flavihumibacter sp. UBA7668 TaxID=1946542 RepID=UPI0025B8A5AD|nr:copper resistance protein NlpE [Flavihumibacter sp. UBA7668]
MLRKLLLATLTYGCFACNDGIEVTTDITVPETKLAISLNELAGYYTDTLPCASCEGILTGLAILDDSTYFLTELYLSEQAIPFGRIGKYSREGDQLLLQFESDSVIRFKILEDRILQLDNDGTEIVSGLDYSLDKATLPANLLSLPFIASGLFKMEAKKANFQLCGQEQAWGVLDDKGLKDAERNLIKQKAELAKGIYLRAAIELQPSTDSTGTTYQVKLNKINDLLAGGCN